jgi:hypothetical protein
MGLQCVKLKTQFLVSRADPRVSDGPGGMLCAVLFLFHWGHNTLIDEMGK